MSVKLIVALGKDGAIGKDGGLIWRLPGDLQRFKALTMGHPVIMGRKTWDSLPRKPLPGRRNIILTRGQGFREEGAESADSVEAALRLCQEEDPFVIGGEQIYRAFMPYVEELYLTLVDSVCSSADAYLQLNLSEGWELIEESDPEISPDGVSYRYLTYKRVPKKEHLSAAAERCLNWKEKLGNHRNQIS